MPTLDDLYAAPAGTTRVQGGIVPAAAPASIVTPPASQSKTAGDVATFTVVYTGGGPFTVRWRKNGAIISGATADTYTTPVLSTADNGAIFDVQVQAATGPAVISAPAVLSVIAETATAFILSGATSGISGVDSALTVTPNGVLAADYVVTLDMPGGILSLSTLNFPAGSSAAQTVNKRRDTDGLSTVTMTNSRIPVEAGPSLVNTGSGLVFSSTPGTYSIDIRRHTNGLARLLMFSREFTPGSAYNRNSTGDVVLTGTTASIDFNAVQFLPSAVATSLQVTSYTLLVNGVPRATTTVTAGASTGTFTLDLTPLAEGWYEFDIVGGPNESCAKYGFYRKVGAGPASTPDHMPVVTGTYELHFQPAPQQTVYAKVPPVSQGTEVPFDKRLLIDRPDNTALLSAANVVHYEFLPIRFGDQHYPALDENGVLMAYAKQDYFQLDYFSDRPRLRTLDGPRGEASVKYVTHLSMSLRAGSRKIYFLDGWRVGSISETGHVTTLAGWRHKNPPGHYQNPGFAGNDKLTANTEPQLELVGDWSAIADPGKHGMWEPWGLAWDETTLAINDAAAPVPGDDLHPPEKPHVIGPVMFVADTRNNRVLKLQFQPAVRTTAVVSEFITGLNDPWAIAWAAGKLYITERIGNKISVYNSTTGLFIENIVDGGVPMFTVPDSTRIAQFNSGATVAAAQARDVQAPEGIFFQDDWIYYGSRIMRCIKRVHVTTKAVELYLQLDRGIPLSSGLPSSSFLPFPDGNSNFLNFSMGDGTFGPRGTVFSATWSNAYYGFPVAILPNNQVWNYADGTHPPAGQNREGVTYVSATVAAKGVLFFTGPLEGVAMVTTRQPYDPSLLPSYGVTPPGYTEFKNGGYHLTHGHHGYGHFGLPVPWDISTNVNTYLRANLHVRPPTWRRGKAVNEWLALPVSSISGLDQSRLSFSGSALFDDVTDTSLWYGPGGGATDNSDNSIGSINLLADAPSWVTRSAATVSGSRTANASYYADGKPAARRVGYSFHHSFRNGRMLAFGVSAASGSGAFSSAAVASFNPATNTWEAAGTYANAAARVSVMDPEGDVWGLADGAAAFSALTHWDRNTKTQTTRADFGTAAGGPIAYDARREYLFSLAFGNGEGTGTDVRAFVYRNLYDPQGLTVPTPTRTAVTLTSIGGALAQFSADAPQFAGMDYDRELDAFLLYDGRTAGVDRRGRVYVIKPNNTTTWDISVLTLGSGSSVPPAVVGGGVFNRFRYVPKLKGFVLWADGTTALWFLPTSFIPS